MRFLNNDPKNKKPQDNKPQNGDDGRQGRRIIFLMVAALIATRPLAHKMLDKTIVPTNADRVLHHTAKVTETIDNENTTGAVYIDGKTWTARSEDGDVIARGSMVTIVRMEGVKLFVRKEREEP